MNNEDHLHLPTWAELETDIPKSDPRFNLDGPWLPKTDWSRDGIIASDDH